jgi:cytochrome P450
MTYVNYLCGRPIVAPLRWLEERTKTMAKDILLDRADPELVRDRYGFYRRLRDEAPVTRTVVNGQASWLLTLFDDVNLAFTDRRIRVQPEVGKIPAYLGTGAASVLYSNSLPFMDDEKHARLRRLASPPFGPKAVATMRSWIEEVIDAGLARLAEHDGDVDFVAEFARLVPAEIACRLVHAPLADAEALVDAQAGVTPLISQDTLTPEVLEAADRAVEFYYEYFGDLVSTLRGTLPEDDPVGLLLAASDDALTTTELLTTLTGYLFASYHTTMVAFTHAVNCLLANREEWDLLAADPELAGPAWDETLRYDTPTHFQPRFVGEDLEFSGQTVEAGSHLLLCVASANRDERRFPEPDKFDIRRPKNRHLSFSVGSHYCLGAPLSRLEGDILLRRLPQRFPNLALADDAPPPRFDDLSFAFITQLMVNTRGAR